MRTLWLIVALLLPYYAFAGPAPVPPVPSPAPTQATCLPTGAVLAALSKRFNESVVWHGVAPGVMLLLTESPGGKTWTLLGETTSAKGEDVSCILDSGDDGSFKRLGYIV